MTTKLSTYYRDDGYTCDVSVDFKEKETIVEYYDATGKSIAYYHYPDKTYAAACADAEEWALGQRVAP